METRQSVFPERSGRVPFETRQSVFPERSGRVPFETRQSVFIRSEAEGFPWRPARAFSSAAKRRGPLGDPLERFHPQRSKEEKAGLRQAPKRLTQYEHPQRDLNPCYLRERQAS